MLRMEEERQMSALDSFISIPTEISTPDDLARELRVQFARIISVALQEHGDWKQNTLAREANMQESRISELAHGDENCTISTMARVLFALKRRMFLIPGGVDTELGLGNIQDALSEVLEGMSHGKEKEHSQETQADYQETSASWSGGKEGRTALWRERRDTNRPRGLRALYPAARSPLNDPFVLSEYPGDRATA